MKHTTRLFWIFAGILILVITSAVIARSHLVHKTAEHAPISLPTALSTTSPPTATPTANPTPHPVSLQAIAQKEFNGHDLTLGRILDDNASYTRYYITYKSGDLTISGIMNKPKGAGPFPVLILNHGYIDPAVYTNGRGLKREQDYLARRGYVVIHPDYRNHAESSKDPEEDYHFRLGYIEDVINAIYAVKAANLPYIDETKIGMLGHSMGGGITLGILTTHPDLVQAAVLFAPVSASAEDNYNKYTANNPVIAARMVELYGTPQSNPEFWKNVSPETFLSNVQAPIMVHHGTVDESTPIDWSNSLVQKLQNADKQVTYHVYPGEPHEFINAWTTVMQRTVSFFDTELK